ncbi:MAG: type II secretion system protein [Rickettsiales bacterium]
MSVSTHSNRAFTLVELSIVLVILGLLVGGILSGQALIRAAELRAVSTEYSRYVTATHTFRDKYLALPGDMNNAVSFWGAATVNGNGDGVVNTGAAGASGEIFQYWNQLAQARLIEGTYTGIAGVGGSGHAIIGTNVPASRLPSTGWTDYYMGNYAGNGEMWTYDYGNNTFFWGASSVGHVTYTSALKPEEAWNIDSKIDDGKPGLGKVMVMWNGCTDAIASTGNASASYALGNATIVCRFVFPRI